MSRIWLVIGELILDSYLEFTWMHYDSSLIVLNVAVLLWLMRLMKEHSQLIFCLD